MAILLFPVLLFSSSEYGSRFVSLSPQSIPFLLYSRSRTLSFFFAWLFYSLPLPAVSQLFGELHVFRGGIAAVVSLFPLPSLWFPFLIPGA